MEFNKLVRDNIPEIIKKDGREPITHIAEDKEYEEALSRKLNEEVNVQRLEFI
jgi:predicted house-cleaning noncanonical NTP pyrophosphatase (MazG superfamily)